MDPQPWKAPHPSAPVHARVHLPGSKSLTNRGLVLAALADGPSRITRPLRARDTQLMVDALRAMGTEIIDDGADWQVRPNAFTGAVVDTGLAGTVMRFVPPIAALALAPVTFDGDDYARERPMWTLIDGLRQAGATVDDAGRGRLPFTVRGSGSVAGGVVHLDASGSSQFVSGLLLVGPRCEQGIEVVHVGSAPVPSTPHIDMTLAMLQASGVQVSRPTPTSWRAEPGPIRAHDLTIEPDLSNAAPFLAAALATGGEVTVANWPTATTQAGDALRDLLAQLGGEVDLNDGDLVVRGTGTIRGIDADLRDVAELGTVIAVLAALADGPSHLSGLAHTRGHETDRLAALARELNALGGDVVEDDDGLTITPRALRPGTWRVYADHRMATAGALLGLAVDGVQVDDIAATTKTLPDFPGLWSRMLEV